MKKAFGLVLALILMAFITATASANGSFTLWQIGKPDGAVNPIVGALEYPANGFWFASFDYTIGADADPINAPTMPGYIGLVNVCDIVGGRPCTDTAASVTINFDLECDYSEGGLTLFYDRYGSESDNLYLDGVNFATISTTEIGFQPLTFDLSAAAGSHTLKIEYYGGGLANGHYIDYLKLVSAFDPETCNIIPVEIDVKPGSDPSCFNSDGRGKIPVAIFGSSTFNVKNIDIDSITMDGAPVAERGKTGRLIFAYEYVNHDAYKDLVVKIVDLDLYDSRDMYATLTGFLNDGTQFEGVGDICITQ